MSRAPVVVRLVIPLLLVPAVNGAVARYNIIKTYIEKSKKLLVN
jgi:hypothetical protein